MGAASSARRSRKLVVGFAWSADRSLNPGTEQRESTFRQHPRQAAPELGIEDSCLLHRVERPVCDLAHLHGVWMSAVVKETKVGLLGKEQAARP